MITARYHILMNPSTHAHFLQAIGNATAEFAVLTNTVETAIWMLLFGNNDDQEQLTALIVTAELAFRRNV
jgi:hypothetical protein